MLCLSIEFIGNESSKYNAVALYSITSIWYYQRTLKRMISNDGDPHCVLCHIIIIPPPYNTPFFNTHKEPNDNNRNERKRRRRKEKKGGPSFTSYGTWYPYSNNKGEGMCSNYCHNNLSRIALKQVLESHNRTSIFISRKAHFIFKLTFTI